MEAKLDVNLKAFYYLQKLHQKCTGTGCYVGFQMYNHVKVL